MVTPIASGFGNWFTSSGLLMVRTQATRPRMREAGADRHRPRGQDSAARACTAAGELLAQSARRSASAAHSPRVRRSSSRIPRRTYASRTRSASVASRPLRTSRGGSARWDRRPAAAAAPRARWRAPGRPRAPAPRAGRSAARRLRRGPGPRSRPSPPPPPGHSRARAPARSRACAATIASTPEPQPRSTQNGPAAVARRLVEQQLQAEPGGGVGAGAERLAGIDDDVERVPPAGSHGGPDGRGGRRAPAGGGTRASARPSRRRPRSVETSTSAPPRRRAQVGERGQLARRPVDRVLDDLGAEVDLLHPARRQLEQLGEHQLGLGAGDADRAQADQPVGSPPKARRSLASTPSSVCRLCSVRLSASCSSSSRCSA